MGKAGKIQPNESVFRTENEPLKKKNGGKTELIENETGIMQLTHYTVFPGIELIYQDAHLQECTQEESHGEMEYVVTHCREGRIECEWQNSFFYLTPGDICVSRRKASRRNSCFPISHYHGLSVQIDASIAKRCLSCFMEDVEVRPSELFERLCGDSDTFIMRANSGLEHIFSELYEVPEEIRNGYFKVKVLELLLFLSCVEEKDNQANVRRVSRSQVELGKRVGKFIGSHLSERITIDHLSQAFHVSPTLLKTSFKGVYGDSVYSYIRTLRMHAAAVTICQSEISIMEIAGMYGYDNAGKFSAAFRDVIGITPNEYRRKYSHRSE